MVEMEVDIGEREIECPFKGKSFCSYYDKSKKRMTIQVSCQMCGGCHTCVGDGKLLVELGIQSIDIEFPDKAELHG